jgi:hypothetical protein
VCWVYDESHILVLQLQAEWKPQANETEKKDLRLQKGLRAEHAAQRLMQPLGWATVWHDGELQPLRLPLKRRNAWSEWART